MRRKDLEERLVDASIPRSIAMLAVEVMISSMSAALKKGEDITLRKLGTLKVRKRAAKIARDMNKGVPLALPPRKTVKFIPSRQVIDSLNGNDDE